MELQRSYGKNPKTKAEVIQAFRSGMDFDGDYTVGFKPVSKEDFISGVRLMLRYDSNRKVAVIIS